MQHNHEDDVQEQQDIVESIESDYEDRLFDYAQE